MISIRGFFLQDKEFTSKYIEDVLPRVQEKKIKIDNKFFGNFDSLMFDEDFLKFILIDPFNNFSNNHEGNEFIKLYLGVVGYLLKSNKYFDYLKENNRVLSLAEKRKLYCQTRKSIIDSFNLVSSYKIPMDAIKSKDKYMFYYRKISCQFDDLNKCISSVFNYNEIIDSKIRVEILNNIEITICPYCNRQYIDFYRRNKRLRSVAQLDHFYPKKKFPLFSMTLANFIPSCSYCNTVLKNDLMFPLVYPYDFCDNKEKIFEIDIYNTGVKTLYQSSDVEININLKSKFYQQLSFFHIKEIYENHKVDVANLINKKNLYNDSYRNMLIHNLDMDISREQFKNILFGFSGEEKDLYTIPLAKLKHDVID